MHDGQHLDRRVLPQRDAHRLDLITLVPLAGNLGGLDFIGGCHRGHALRIDPILHDHDAASRGHRRRHCRLHRSRSRPRQNQRYVLIGISGGKGAQQLVADALHQFDEIGFTVADVRLHQGLADARRHVYGTGVQ